MVGPHLGLAQTDEDPGISQELAGRTHDPRAGGKPRVEYVRMLLESEQRQNVKDWKKIEQELDEVEKTLVKTFDVALLRAELSFVQGEKNKAETLLQQTIKEHPNRHEPWLALIAFAS